MDNRHIDESAFERLTDAAADDGARFGIDEQLGHIAFSQPAAVVTAPTQRRPARRRSAGCVATTALGGSYRHS
ncbi:MAG: hypothetical protein JWR48_22 [Mycobacterium sp.]|nr:hypothetical protein [Mycobacterium sp.]